jgi:hypothetical protein
MTAAACSSSKHQAKLAELSTTKVTGGDLQPAEQDAAARLAQASGSAARLIAIKAVPGRYELGHEAAVPGDGDFVIARPRLPRSRAPTQEEGRERNCDRRGNP